MPPSRRTVSTAQAPAPPPYFLPPAPDKLAGLDRILRGTADPLRPPPGCDRLAADPTVLLLAEALRGRRAGMDPQALRRTVEASHPQALAHLLRHQEVVRATAGEAARDISAAVHTVVFAIVVAVPVAAGLGPRP